MYEGWKREKLTCKIAEVVCRSQKKLDARAPDHPNVTK